MKPSFEIFSKSFHSRHANANSDGLVDALVEDADPDVTRKLVHGRDTLMDAIPDVKMIRSFSSWTDLETKVRAHLRIVETV